MNRYEYSSNETFLLNEILSALDNMLAIFRLVHADAINKERQRIIAEREKREAEELKMAELRAIWTDEYKNLGLSAYATNALVRSRISLSDAVKLTDKELLRVRHFGNKSLVAFRKLTSTDQ